MGDCQGGEDADTGLLTYETQSYRPTTYRWSGKEALVVRDVAVVTADPKEAAPKTPIEPDEPSGNEISRAINDAREALSTTITRMGIYILIMLGMILIALWHFH